MFVARRPQSPHVTRLIWFFLLIVLFLIRQVERAMVVLIIAFSSDKYVSSQPFFYYLTPSQLIIRTLIGYRFIPYGAIISISPKNQNVLIETSQKKWLVKPLDTMGFFWSLENKRLELLQEKKHPLTE